MTDNITSQNIGLYSWITPYLYIHFFMLLFREIVSLAVIALHEMYVLLVTWLSLWYFHMWIIDLKVSALFSLPISLFGMFISVSTQLVVFTIMKNVLSHWSSVRFLVIGLSSPCKVACHSKTVSCSATVLSIDTFCVCSDLLIARYHYPYRPLIVGPAWKLPTFVCTLHASSWPLSREFVWLSCSLIHNWNIYLFSVVISWRTEGGKSDFAKSYNGALLGFCTWRIIQILH